MRIGDFDCDRAQRSLRLARARRACASSGLPDDAEHVNPNGGAIALGHPLGMSGARIAMTAAHQLGQDRRQACARHHVRRRRPGRLAGDRTRWCEPPLPVDRIRPTARDVEQAERACDHHILLEVRGLQHAQVEAGCPRDRCAMNAATIVKAIMNRARPAGREAEHDEQPADRLDTRAEPGERVGEMIRGCRSSPATWRAGRAPISFRDAADQEQPADDHARPAARLHRRLEHGTQGLAQRNRGWPSSCLSARHGDTFAKSSPCNERAEYSERFHSCGVPLCR